MAAKDEFKNFSFLIIFVMILYTLTLLVFLCIRRRQIAVARAAREDNVADPIYYDDEAAYSFDLTTKFEGVLETTLGDRFTHVLTCTRIMSFLYFFIVGCILNGATQENAFYYFENWCALIVMVYFLLASTAGLVKVYTDRTRSALDMRLNAQAAWTLKVRLLGMLVHLLFEVAGGTSLFVMVLVYTVGDNQSTDAVNSVHFTAFIIMFIELCLCTMRVRFDQFPACIAFLMFYLLVIWPGVFTGVIPDWPYAGMSTKDQSCFQNYFVVLVLNFFLYTAWYVLYKVKKLLLVFRQRLLVNEANEAGSVVEMQFGEGSSAQGDDQASEQSSNYGGEIMQMSQSMYGYPSHPAATHSPFPPPQYPAQGYGGGAYPPPYSAQQYPPPPPQSTQWQQPAGGYRNPLFGHAPPPRPVHQQGASVAGSTFNDDTLNQFAFADNNTSSYSSQY